MAIVNHTTHNVGGILSGRRIIKWANLTLNDRGQPFDIDGDIPQTITFETQAPLSHVAIVEMQASNKETTPVLGLPAYMLSTEHGPISVKSICRWYWPVALSTLGGNTATIFLLVDKK